MFRSKEFVLGHKAKGASQVAQQKRIRLPSRDTGSIPGLRRSPGEGNGNRLQYPRLGNPKDRGAQRVTVHRVTNSRRSPSH